MTTDPVLADRPPVSSPAQVDGEPCQHESRSGDEGAVRDLPGSFPVRWRCDGCGAVLYDDAALARLRRLLTPSSLFDALYDAMYGSTVVHGEEREAVAKLAESMAATLGQVR